MPNLLPLIIIIVAAFLAFVLGAWLAKRKGYKRTGDVIVRCRKGHLFTTVWDAPLSRSRIDVGFARIQRCPVGDHLTLVRPVDESTLTPEERKVAKKQRDLIRYQ